MDWAAPTALGKCAHCHLEFTEADTKDSLVPGGLLVRFLEPTVTDETTRTTQTLPGCPMDLGCIPHPCVGPSSVLMLHHLPPRVYGGQLEGQGTEPPKRSLGAMDWAAPTALGKYAHCHLEQGTEPPKRSLGAMDWAAPTALGKCAHCHLEFTEANSKDRLGNQPGTREVQVAGIRVALQPSKYTDEMPFMAGTDEPPNRSLGAMDWAAPTALGKYAHCQPQYVCVGVQLTSLTGIAPLTIQDTLYVYRSRLWSICFSVYCITLFFNGQDPHRTTTEQLEHPHTVPADGAVGVEVEVHQVFWTCDNKPSISVLTTVPPHMDSLGVSTKTKAGLVTEDDPLPFCVAPCQSVLRGAAVCQWSTRSSPPAPWLSDVLRNNRRELRRAERKWRRSQLDSDLHTYQAVLSRFSAEVTTAKSSFYKRKLEESASDPRKLFSIFSSLLNPPSPPPPSSLTPEDFVTFFEEKMTSYSYWNPANHHHDLPTGSHPIPHCSGQSPWTCYPSISSLINSSLSSGCVPQGLQDCQSGSHPEETLTGLL
ncbi:hypothetical protein NFI96_006230 [Prochilodus magdalenae]|nr:hypothetical protein NFI96_006230 [Prochilodus magdalenae]